MAKIEKILEIMSRLRDPEQGCPWDREQTYDTIVPYTLEEAYEVADAIYRKDWEELRSELGDLLFQVVFYAQIAKEEGRFDFTDVVEAISEKMIRRHPHVFAGEQITSAEQQTKKWDEFKEEEKKKKGNTTNGSGLLADLPMRFPALSRARKMQSKMAKVGFDWPELSQVFDKLDEEIGELKQGLANRDQQNIEEEMGDLLFMCVNLARQIKVDPEKALHNANEKFRKRVEHMEEIAGNHGKVFAEMSLPEMEELWLAAKKAHKPHL